MDERLQSLVEETPAISSQAELTRFLRHVRRAYDLDNAIYYALSLGGEKAGEEFGAMTYPAAWHERYEDVRYRDCDPVVIASTATFAPFDWRTLDWTGRPLRRMLAEAKEFRVGNQGYSIPLHGPQGQFAMFSVSKQCAPETWALRMTDMAGELLLIAHHVHRQVLDLTGAEQARVAKPLSPREREALTLIACGRSRGQVAERLEISESTLRVYLDSARHKLGGLNTFHAVAIAMKNRAIHV
ncbi:MAG: LuxR family transcriptional regulator [Pseudomonadota bacterium]